MESGASVDHFIGPEFVTRARARLKLEVPKRLNKKQRELLEEFRKIS